MDALQSGADTSSQKGYITGYAKGLQLAIDVGMEIGGYEGYSKAMLSLQSLRPCHKEEKRNAQFKRVISFCQEINPKADDESIFKSLEKLRTRATMAAIPNISASKQQQHESLEF